MLGNKHRQTLQTCPSTRYLLSGKMLCVWRRWLYHAIVLVETCPHSKQKYCGDATVGGCAGKRPGTGAGAACELLAGSGVAGAAAVTVTVAVAAVSAALALKTSGMGRPTLLCILIISWDIHVWEMSSRNKRLSLW